MIYYIAEKKKNEWMNEQTPFSSSSNHPHAEFVKSINHILGLNEFSGLQKAACWKFKQMFPFINATMNNVEKGEANILRSHLQSQRILRDLFFSCF